MKTKLESEVSALQEERSSQPTFAFESLSTGVWDYDLMGRLVFDPKFRDLRQGYVTFGNAALVLYLQQSQNEAFGWHCRVDIPYATLEHVLPAVDHAGRGAITLTLKSPPKFYNIRSTDDLHLYSGSQAPQDLALSLGLSKLTLGPRRKTHRLERLCSLNSFNTKNSALCMVYRIAFADLQTAEYAFNFVKDFSVPEVHWWKTMVPRDRMFTIESEYTVVESMLSIYTASTPPSFSFAVRFQLLALVLEGTVTPLKMIGLIPKIQEVAKTHGGDQTATAVRKVGRQVPTPALDTDAEHFQVSKLVELVEKSIKDSRAQEKAHQYLHGQRKKHHHLALTYKATVTPTGKLARGNYCK